MDFLIENFGKIKKADLKLDGITVICGNNNTGKSTVGKALFAFFNALFDYKNRIIKQKCSAFTSFLFKHIENPFEKLSHESNDKSIFDYISTHSGIFDINEIKIYLKEHYEITCSKDELNLLVEQLNTSEDNVLNEYVFRYFSNVMNGQIKNVYSNANSRCAIIAKFKNNKNTIKLKKQSCCCELETSIKHNAYYINSPFALDYLNQRRISFVGMNQMQRNVIDAILEVQSDMNEDSMTNILDSVINKNDLNEVREILRKAYTGDTRFDQGRYFYIDNGVSFDFKNISAGLKSFAIIERLLESGVLKRKDVLILDEPEIHLHSEWQIIYAELIVILQKKFELTILIVTHSFQFLESLDFFMKNYKTSETANYYIPEKTDNGFIMKSCGNSPDELKLNLINGSVQLANMEFEFNMNNMEQEDNGTQDD